MKEKKNNSGLSEEDIQKIIDLVKGLNEENKYAYHRLLPFPHLRLNKQNIVKDLFPIEPMQGGALPVYHRNDEEE